MGESTASSGAGTPAPEGVIGGEALVRARELLGLTVDQLAAELGVTPHVFEAWERGALTVPPRYRQVIAYRVAIAERDAALAASGLPECPWFSEWERTEVPAARSAWARHMQLARQHAAFCPTCRAREQFLHDRFPPLPTPPVPHWVVLVRRFNAWLQHYPDWLRPAIVGALALGGLTLVRVIFSARELVRGGDALLGGATAVAFGTVAGAVAGAVYGVLRRLVTRGAPRQ